MRIKSIDLFKRRGVGIPGYLVRVTAENGIIGYGEIYDDDAGYYLEKFAPALIARSIYRLDDMLEPFGVRSVGAQSEALGAVNAAMWDILGKKTKQPVYNIMGGKIDHRINLCATGWDRNAVEPRQYALAAKDAVDRGYKCIKVNPLGALDKSCFENYRLLMEPFSDVLSAIREKIGKGVNLCVEMDGRLTFDQSLRALDDAGKRFDIYYVANPANYGHTGGLKKLSMCADIPIAVGRGAASLREMQSLMESGDVSIMQYDAIRLGGISEARYFASIEEAYYLKYAPIHLGGVPSLFANAMVAACIPSLSRVEADIERMDSDEPAFACRHKIVNGALLLDDGAPGLGFEPNMTEFEEARHENS